MKLVVFYTVLSQTGTLETRKLELEVSQENYNVLLNFEQEQRNDAAFIQQSAAMKLTAICEAVSELSSDTYLGIVGFEKE